ncbi:hypothetical protein B8W73_08535 [Arthrobacter agilis]|nr:hypothetical protein B8W73_08535 [Arthrobacter agilis]
MNAAAPARRAVSAERAAGGGPQADVRPGRASLILEARTVQADPMVGMARAVRVVSAIVRLMVGMARAVRVVVRVTDEMIRAGSGAARAAMSARDRVPVDPESGHRTVRAGRPRAAGVRSYVVQLPVGVLHQELPPTSSPVLRAVERRPVAPAKAASVPGSRAQHRTKGARVVNVARLSGAVPSVALQIARTVVAAPSVAMMIGAAEPGRTMQCPQGRALTTRVTSAAPTGRIASGLPRSMRTSRVMNSIG